ncbi:hypothetical protein F5I97DRAFT_1847343 [Phlebopus sp. FC_14]|nr:hypothetical protein F5I97DRAFT_1847343 [Phlebopus sp. FC_14]
MATVVTITPHVTATPSTTPGSATAPSSSLSPGAIVGIAVGCLFGLALLVGLVLYLRHRHRRAQFIRVANPRQQWSEPAAGLRGLSTPMATVQSKGWFAHAKQPTTSLEPLIPPVQWPATRSTPPSVQFPFTPSRRPDSPSPTLPDIPASGDGRLTFNDDYFGTYAEANRAPLTDRGSATPENISPPRTPQVIVPRHSHFTSHPNHGTPSNEQSGYVSPRPLLLTQSPSEQPETSSAELLQPHPTLFLSRALKTRAAASQYAADQPHSPFSHPGSPNTPVDLSMDTEEPNVLAGLRDAEEVARVKSRDDEEGGSEEEDDPPDSAVSEYSQLSAPLDHSAFLSVELVRQNSSRSLGRRKSSRRRFRTQALTAELPPVAEVPDTPRNISLPGSPPATTTHANAAQELKYESSSLSVQISHGRPSRPSSIAADHNASFPLLSSNAFGKGSLTPAASASSRSSDVGWDSSSSSGKASRCPSLALSSNARSSSPGRHSEGNTDWYHHRSSGLANLKNLQLNPPSSSSIEPPLPSLPSDIPLSSGMRQSNRLIQTPDRRARLRERTSGSVPEVERHSVQMGDIASIDVAL